MVLDKTGSPTGCACSKDILPNVQKHAQINKEGKFLISNFCCVLNVVRFLLGNSPQSEFYMPTFRNTLFHLHQWVGMMDV